MGLTVDKGEWKVINEGESFNYSAVAFPKSGTQITKKLSFTMVICL